MADVKFNIPERKLRVLLAPLDWGLGHASRCIPIIHELVGNDCDVFIGAEGATRALLQKEFPELHFISLKGYNIKYSRRKFGLMLKLIVQFPKLILRIYKEHQWLKNIVDQYKIDAIISDNRLGLYHSKIPCVYITHQLQIKTGNRFTEKIAQQLHYWFIKKYNQCWVPDFKGEKNIGGELSHPKIIPAHVKYIGALSRFEKLTNVEQKYSLAIILSGPEPQRTIFENILLTQLKERKEPVLFVRGLPGGNNKIQSTNTNVVIVNHLSSEELNIAIQQSGSVISRSGYTTVMDLIKLNKKAVFVATPGQTEQEYLAKHLQEENIFLSKQQDAFGLLEALDEAKSFAADIPAMNMYEYKHVLKDFIKQL
ncbi:glycosyltransferase [Ferruginibacter albus]|uniref:glycosyltransferase n=1 Tax=Ferruginibacter albus TaxID=2875540 RepID=UPI001CC51034|nr:glycosyltransferase [Ferruginibacter albus]UAY52045.1 glycosyl transferase family 28 [Ferruginibacter albus]